MPKTTTTSSSSSSQQNLIPGYIEEQGKFNLGLANTVAGQYRPVLREAPAGWTADQLAAQQYTRDLFSKHGAPAARTSNLADELSTYRPEDYVADKLDPTRLASILSGLQGGGASADSLLAMMGGGGGASAGQIGNIADITAGNIDRSSIRDVTSRMTPEAFKEYLAAFDPAVNDAVMNATMNDLDRSRQIVQQQNASAANKAGAFGGSRHGLVEAETNRNYADVVGRTSADLRQQAVDRALGAFNADEVRAMQAQQANQGIDWQTGNANVLNALEAAKSNQAKELQRQGQNAQYSTQASIANAQTRASAQQQAASLAYQGSLQRALEAAELGYKGLEYDTTSGNYAKQFNINADITNNANRGSLLGTLNTIDNDTLTRDAYGLTQLGNSGNAQQAFNQLGADTRFANANAVQQAPIEALAIRQAALSNTPYSTSTEATNTGTSTAKTSTPWYQTFGQITGGVGALSDERLKRDIHSIKSPLEKLRQMEGVDYEWRGSGAKDLGLVAQDVQHAMPEAVSDAGGELEGYKQYSMPAVLGLLTQAVKELDRRLDRRTR